MMSRIRSVNRKARNKLHNSFEDRVLKRFEASVGEMDNDFIYAQAFDMDDRRHYTVTIGRGYFKNIKLVVGLVFWIRIWRNQGIEVFPKPKNASMSIYLDPDPIWDKMKDAWYAAMNNSVPVKVSTNVG